MTQNTKIWVRRVYYALITLALITVAALFIAQCVAIYRLGNNPFTRESIAAHFAPIAVPVYVCIGLVVAGFALSSLLPAAPDATPDRDEVTLRRLQGKTALSLCPQELVQRIETLRRGRKLYRNLTLILLAVGTAVCLWYFLDITRFPKNDPNGAMIRAMGVLGPCMGIPFVWGVVAALLRRRSVKEEIALLRTAPREAVSPAPAVAVKKDYTSLVQGVVLAVAVGCIVYGLLIGGAVEVLAKALKICTECIGLG